MDRLQLAWSAPAGAGCCCAWACSPSAAASCCSCRHGRRRPAAAQAVGSLQADFDNDGFADLSVGVPGEDIGTTRDAGAVNVLYGAGGGLSGTGSQLFNQGGGGVNVLYGAGNGLAAAGNQQFWQGANGLAGVAEEGDIFASNLVGSDQQPGGSATNAARSRPGASAPRLLDGR